MLRASILHLISEGVMERTLIVGLLIASLANVV